MIKNKTKLILQKLLNFKNILNFDRVIIYLICLTSPDIPKFG
jgi:hypothetical protein